MKVTKIGRGKHLYAEIIMQLSKKRWIFANVIFVILAIYKLIGLKSISVVINQEFTVLDSWLYVYSNRKIMVFILLPLFFYLVSDVLWNPQIDEYVLIRTKCRMNWLVTKIKSMFLLSFIYYMNSTIITLMLSFFMFRSKFCFFMTEEIISIFSLDINPVLFKYDIFQVLVFLIVINILGLFALCVIQGVLSLQFRKNVYGWLFGIVVVVMGLIEASTPIHSSFVYLMPHKHLMMGSYNIRNIVFDYDIFILRLIYWFLVFILFVGYACNLVKKYKFMSGDRFNE
jgi:hypothetical protein